VQRGGKQEQSRAEKAQSNKRSRGEQAAGVTWMHEGGTSILGVKKSNNNFSEIVWLDIII